MASQSQPCRNLMYAGAHGSLISNTIQPEKEILHNETFGILTSQLPSWLGPFVSFTLSRLQTLPQPHHPPQIDEYSRCAYVVHRCVVVSSATKGPMHVTFKALFCTMEHTRYVNHTRSSVLELLNSKLI